MSRGPVILMLGIVAAMAGCASEPAAPPEPGAAPPAERNIRALEPRDMAQQVDLTPRFRWKLPSRVSPPNLITFTLAEAGDGDQPVTDAAGQRPLAIASGLHDVSPEELDPFHPPAGCVLTGDLRDRTRLRPGIWHHWVVRVIGSSETARADFFFRTRAEGSPPAEGAEPRP